MEDAKFLGERLCWIDTNTGRPVFEMKQKNMEDYGKEGIYYIFKVYKENISSAENKHKLLKQGLPIIQKLAGQMGIPLYDFDEITERSQEAMVKLLRTNTDIESKQVDVVIEIMDHGTGHLHNLTIGIQAREVNDPLYTTPEDEEP